MKLNDIITPDQLREQMFQRNDPAVQQSRWEKCFDQIEPFALMIAEESRKRRVPLEIAGQWTSLLVCITNHLMEEEKRTS